MTLYVKPTIAVLLGVMAFQSFYESYFQIGIGHILFLGIGSYLLIQKVKVHPGLVVLASLIYGAINL